MEISPLLMRSIFLHPFLRPREAGYFVPFLYNQAVWPQVMAERLIMCIKFYITYLSNLSTNVMTNHLQKCQKMSPSDYYQAHVTVPEQALKSQQKISATATSSVQSEGGVSPFDDWIFAQKFVCLLCPDKFKFLSQLSHHLRGKHNLSKEEYQELKKSMPKNPVKEHRCCLCSRNVVQNYVELAKHFKLSHANVTVKDYYENHIANKGSASTSEEDNRPPRYDEWLKFCCSKDIPRPYMLQVSRRRYGMGQQMCLEVSHVPTSL